MLALIVCTCTNFYGWNLEYFENIYNHENNLKIHNFFKKSKKLSVGVLRCKGNFKFCYHAFQQLMKFFLFLDYF